MLILFTWWTGAYLCMPMDYDIFRCIWHAFSLWRVRSRTFRSNGKWKNPISSTFQEEHFAFIYIFIYVWMFPTQSPGKIKHFYPCLGMFSPENEQDINGTIRKRHGFIVSVWWIAVFICLKENDGELVMSIDKWNKNIAWCVQVLVIWRLSQQFSRSPWVDQILSWRNWLKLWHRMEWKFISKLFSSIC